MKNFSDELKKHKYWLGGLYRGLMISSGTQNMEGMLVGATPADPGPELPLSNGPVSFGPFDGFMPRDAFAGRTWLDYFEGTPFFQ